MFLLSGVEGVCITQQSSSTWKNTFLFWSICCKWPLWCLDRPKQSRCRVFWHPHYATSKDLLFTRRRSTVSDNIQSCYSHWFICGDIFRDSLCCPQRRTIQKIEMDWSLNSQFSLESWIFWSIVTPCTLPLCVFTESKSTEKTKTYGCLL